jgi:hypothetical protein
MGCDLSVTNLWTFDSFFRISENQILIIIRKELSKLKKISHFTNPKMFVKIHLIKFKI